MNDQRGSALRRVRRGLVSWGRRLAAVRPPAPPLRPPPPSATDVPTLDELLHRRAHDDPPTAGSGTTQTETETQEPVTARSTRFGAPGRPFNRSHPFYVGFIGALGVLVAWGLVNMLGEMSAVLTLIAISLFLALGLDPLVRSLQDRGVPRVAAITVVFLGVLAVFGAFISSVIPPVVSQATQLASQLPEYVTDVQEWVERSEWLSGVDAEYGITERVQTELENSLASGETVSAVFGGIFGAGRAVASGLFSTVTVLVLTLYFLASLHAMMARGYRLVPASRRERIQLLGDEVTRRIGGFVGGQLLLASINGLATFVVLGIMEIPYAAVLAFTVGLLGLIPLVGAMLGAVIVVVVALFTSLSDAVILTIYYVVYQQLENYVLAPRIMARRVAAPAGVVMVAALAGGSLLGVLGALIAIPLAASLLLIIDEVVIPQQDRA